MRSKVLLILGTLVLLLTACETIDPMLTEAGIELGFPAPAVTNKLDAAHSGVPHDMSHLWLVQVPTATPTRTFDVQVWVAPVNEQCSLEEVAVLLEFPVRKCMLAGSVYQQAATLTRGPQVPARVTMSFPLRNQRGPFNDVWYDGTAWFLARAPAHDQYVITEATLIATLHWKWVGGCGPATIAINKPNFTYVYGALGDSPYGYYATNDALADLAVTCTP